MGPLQGTILQVDLIALNAQLLDLDVTVVASASLSLGDTLTVIGDLTALVNGVTDLLLDFTSCVRYMS